MIVLYELNNSSKFGTQFRTTEAQKSQKNQQ